VQEIRISEAHRQAIASLLETPVEPGTKGLRPQLGPIMLSEIGRRGWSLLNGDLTLPVAVLRKSALAANSATMRDFLATRDMLIAPHGKTTMAPQLYAMQLFDGAWGITVSTIHHLAVCRRFGIDRILIANQIVGRAEIEYLFDTLTTLPQLELYCLVDSVEGVGRLVDGAHHYRNAGRLNCLVEVGVLGGRAGCRSLADALAVARAAVAGGLTLRGVECFEGLLPDTASVDTALDFVCDTAAAIAVENLFAAGQPVILTAGGSSFYDRVVARLRSGRRIAPDVKIVSRSGCYLTHDSGVYADAFAHLQRREPALAKAAFHPALFVFAYVQSRPETGKAILSFGRRDVGFDAGLPVPALVYRQGRDTRPIPIGHDHKLAALNDQHAHLTLPDDSNLAVGDMVGFGVSHPCTTFDKWQVLFVIDDDYRVVDAIRTFF
jgi:D-serine dehydratase